MFEGIACKWGSLRGDPDCCPNLFRTTAKDWVWYQIDASGEFIIENLFQNARSLRLVVQM